MDSYGELRPLCCWSVKGGDLFIHSQRTHLVVMLDHTWRWAANDCSKGRLKMAKIKCSCDLGLQHSNQMLKLESAQLLLVQLLSEGFVHAVNSEDDRDAIVAQDLPLCTSGSTFSVSRSNTCKGSVGANSRRASPGQAPAQGICH